MALAPLVKLIPPSKRTPTEYAEYIAELVDGTAGAWDYDDITSIAYSDPLVTKAQQKLYDFEERYWGPTNHRKHPLNDEGHAKLRELAAQLRSGHIDDDL